MEWPEYDLLVGIDWATEVHEVAVVDRQGRVLAKRSVKHSGAAIGEFIDWLIARAEGQAGRVAVAIEVPRGALVEMLCDRGIAVYSINPKQLDRFRDRYTVAGAKDDRLDAYVLGDCLRTDLHLFRQVKVDDPLQIQLREFSRLHDDLMEEISRLTNRLREQLYRYFPQMLALCGAADEAWFWDLVDLLPTPADAHTVRPARISRLLQKHRIRRLSAEQILAELRTPPVHVAPGTTEAARAHLRLLLPRLRLLKAQQRENDKQIKAVLEHLCAKLAESTEGQRHEHPDAAILLSMPGIGIHVAATLLGEAGQALADRDYHALRTFSGQAPVTRRSGKKSKTPTVVRRRACNHRLTNAMYHATRVQAQCDPAARACYAELRARGHTHGRALRSLGDRMFRILVAMLRTGTLYDPSKLRATAQRTSEHGLAAA